MDALDDVPVDSERDTEFDRAFELLLKLVDLRRADEIMPLGPGAVDTASVVLWLLVYQRLRRSATLQTAVKHLVDSASELCVDNKRLRQQTLSSGAGTYSDGRQRLTPEVTEWFANEVRRSIIATSTPTLGGRRVFVVDGTTMTLAPEKALQAAFPPASNPHGEGVWPVALLVVAHELESGAATQPEIGAMYGPQAVSEVQLAQACFARLPADSIVMADANFGIFSVAWGAAQHEHSFLFRRTEPRFHALRKRATGVGEGDNWKTWSLAWIPSVKDRKTNPDLPTDAVVEGLLHEIVVPEKLTLRKSTVMDWVGKIQCRVRSAKSEVPSERGTTTLPNGNRHPDLPPWQALRRTGVSGFCTLYFALLTWHSTRTCELSQSK